MWNETKFGYMEKKKRALLDDIKGLHGVEEHRSVSSKEKLWKDATTIELEKSFLLEEVCWRKNPRRCHYKRVIKLPISSTRLLTLIEDITR